jgi:hypothetical protein
VPDFAAAYLYVSPDQPQDVIEEWLAEKLEQFGERWPMVPSVMAPFRGMGIFLEDVKLGNLEVGSDE